MKQPGKHASSPWALATGASSGIGGECARQAAASGINVVLLARREERLKEAAAGLTARYDVQARIAAADLGRDGIPGRVTEAAGDLVIGLLVSNAGAGNPGPFISLPRERLREIVQLNVIAHLDLARHFGQRLAKRGRGGIVLVSAAAAAGGLLCMANDSATKACPLNLGEVFHVELSGAGAGVTVLAPVLVNTGVAARMGIDAVPLPAGPDSAEQAIDEALTALQEHQATTVTRAEFDPGVPRHQGSCGRGDQSAPRGVLACALNRSGLAAARQRTSSRSPLVSTGKENQMKFLLQVRFNGADKVIGELPAGEQQKVTAEFEAIRQSSGVLDGNQLQAAGTAVTVRVEGGQPQVTQGPAVEAGSEVDVYYVYDAPGLDAATAFAARIPVARLGGTVEVRPMLER
jgi:short-subunit dehydrogenase